MSYSTKILVVLFAHLTIVDFAASQGLTDYPEWVSSSLRDKAFLPPEYTGPYPDRVRREFRGRPWDQDSFACAVMGSPSSGVLAIDDRRSRGLGARVGWDTTLSRVYSVRCEKRYRIPKVEHSTHVVTGWDAAQSRSKVVLLVVPDEGALSQTSVLTAPTGQIWNAGSLVGTTLYIHDLQHHVIRRYLDTDGDRMPDTEDAGFVVPVPQDESMNSPARAMAFNAAPILGFASRHGHVVRLVTSSQLSVRDVFVDEFELGYRLVLGEKGDSILTTSNEFFEGQSRVQVNGTKGLEFVVVTVAPDQPERVVSTFCSIGVDGVAFVDLLEPLVAGTSVRVKPAESTMNPTPWRVVKVHQGAILFALPRFCENEPNQGQSVEVHGDGFLPTMEAWYTPRQSFEALALPTTVVDKHRMEVELMRIGDPSAVPPHDNCQYGTLEIRDRHTGKRCSNVVKVVIAHD